jgi:hypothetical protein
MSWRHPLSAGEVPETGAGRGSGGSVTRVGSRAGTVWGVDVRIGVTQAPREISLEVADGDRDDLKARVEAALSGATDVLWVTDKRGRDVGIPAAKIAYVEVGSAESDRRIGFGS